MAVQYWCPLHQTVVAGDVNGVWWQFHDSCNRDYHHRQIDEEHAVTMEIWPLGDEYVYYVAACACGYRSHKQAVERAAEWLWWQHYRKTKSQVTEGVDTTDY